MREQDLGGRRRADFLAELRVPVTRLVEPVDEAAQVVLQHVVAEVHHEVVVAEEVAGDQHAVGQTAGRVLLDVRDLDAELRAVADRSPDLGAGLADDDADVLDAGRRELLDPVEDDRLVGDRHELLGARVRDRTKPRADAAGEDQPLHPARN